MNKSPSRPPASIDATLDLLAGADYLADRSLATVLFLALKMGRPLFLEGEAGVGKTEIAKVLSRDARPPADPAAVLRGARRRGSGLRVELRRADDRHPRRRGARASTTASGLEHDVFSERFLIKRPLLQALEPDTAGAPVLLIDELDRADEAFEAFLLEVLADFQVTIPELGTVKAAQPPIVIITSNRTREIHDALKRRCLYHWVGYPNAERELAIVRAKVPGIGKALSEQVVHFVQALRKAGPVQVARRRRDARLGGGAGRARRGGARPRDRLRHARRAAQVSGRHRAHRRHQGQGAARRGARRACGRRSNP